MPVAASEEPIYSVEQIRIQPELPTLLKDYAKHILRTKPSDIVQASADYFQNLLREQASASRRGLTDGQLEVVYLKV